MDLFSRGGYSSWDLFEEFTPETYEHNFPRIIDLKINAASGRYDVVAVTNWANETMSREISFASNLGLDPDSSYLVFDFWNPEFLGMFKESVELIIEPHDTRVLHIRPVHQRPQILATNRHISGAYSIESLEWYAEKQTLEGTSKTIAGTSYSLFIYVPEKFTLSKIISKAKAAPEKINDMVFKVTLEPDEKMTNWSIIFKE
jgi:hypothetical protein